MSCPTATRWFVPDHEFYATDDDYAVVGMSEKLVRRQIDDGNNDGILQSPDGSPECVIYFDELLSKTIGRQTPCYDFAVSGRMLWADVDDSKPQHRSEVQALVKDKGSSKEGDYEDIWKEFWPLMDIALKAQIEKVKSKRGESKISAPDGDEDKCNQDLRERYLYRRLREWCKHGCLEPVVFNTLFTGLKTAEKRQAMINMLTFQAPSGKSRPLMVLVSMVDSLQTSRFGEKEGWAVVYDINRDLFICKPFFSNEERHPLTSPWYTDVKDDGVSFSWAPRIFIEQYLELSDMLDVKLGSGIIREKQVTQEEKETDGEVPDLEILDKAFAFRLVLHTNTARFVLTHWSAMVESRSESSKEYQAELYSKVKDAIRKLEGILRRVHVPVVAKPEKIDKKFHVHAVEDMEWALEEQEAYFRISAVLAKENGHPKAAENVAKLYKSILGMIKGFNLDPEKEM
ncbi:hypothetical protein G7Y79_00026g059540 [Physcia stellaris]|nr:hypothetical protein G7Y79_00026g059540 [Physcia stellaris]